MKELDIHTRFKIVVRNDFGRVNQIHETQGSQATLNKVHEELSWIVNHRGSSKNTITVTKLV